MMGLQEGPLRQSLQESQRIVVKVGSRVLVERNGKPKLNRFQSLVDDVSALRREGREVVLVSSGAIGSGMERLGVSRRPKNLPELQMAAAIGQVRLLSRYDQLFAIKRCPIAQVLLTYDDLNNRRRHLNARNTLLTLMRNGIIPIVNENDVVSVDEIKLGDNDVLAALVSVLVDADLLILLSTVNGLRDMKSSGRSSRVSFLPKVAKRELGMVEAHRSEISTGGMSTKLEAAKTASEAGIPVVIADGRKSQTLRRVISGESLGTLIAANKELKEGSSLRSRKRWISLFNRAQGSLVVDKGASRALCSGGKSLLPVGVQSVEGAFEQGALVNVRAGDGQLIARGLVSFSSKEISAIRGKKTSEVVSLLGADTYDEVIHRDNLVILKGI